MKVFDFFLEVNLEHGFLKWVSFFPCDLNFVFYFFIWPFLGDIVTHFSLFHVTTLQIWNVCYGIISELKYLLKVKNIMVCWDPCYYSFSVFKLFDEISCHSEG